MKQSKRIIALILSLVMCMAIFAACGEKASTETPGASNTGSANPSQGGNDPTTPDAPGGDLEAPPPTGDNVKFVDHIEVISDSTPIGVLCPFAAAGTGSSTNWVYGMIYDTLIKMEQDGTIIPNLATSWATEDYQTYTFELRDDVYWHNGDKFTAQDVIWTQETAVASPGGFPSWDYWKRIAKVTAIDDYTIEVVTNSVNVDFYYGLSVMYCGIVNGNAIAADDEKGWWVGTGAYKVKGFSSKDYVEFERNDNYWGPVPLTKTQTWRFIPEMATRTIMLQNGEADICFELSSNDMDVFRDNKDFILFKSGTLNPISLNMNQSDPLMSDPNFKQAVLYALDREEIGLFANGELALPVPDGALWGRTTIHRNTDIPIITQDIEKSKEYLAASSYNNETVIITAAINYNIRAAEAIQQQLAKVGIKTEVNQLDTAGFTSATTWAENKTQMNIWANMLGLSPFGFLNSFLQGAAHNRAKLVNDELETLLQKMYTMTDDAERDASWKRAQEIVFEEVATTTLFYRAGALVGRAGTGGIGLPPSALYDLRYMYIVES